MGVLPKRVGTDVVTVETHINAFKQETLDAVQKAYAAIGELEAKVNKLITKYEE